LEGITMKTNKRAIAAGLAAAAIVGAIGLAPVAAANPGTAGAPQAAVQKAVPAAPAPPPGPVQAPTPSGGDPQVPFGSGFDFGFNSDGNSLAS
jgi:hypothetical protein